MHQIDYRYLRPQKAEALKALHEEPLDQPNTPEIWYGQSATILPVKKADQWNWGGFGGVIDENGTPVDLSATPPMVRLGTKPPSAEYKDEKVVYCGYLMHHWGHFLVDSVSRLWYFLENDTTIDKYIFTLEENATRDITGNFKEFLVLLNIWDKIEFITKPTTFREVVVPGLGFVRGKYYSLKYLSVFDKIAENISIDPAWNPLDKIFFSRSQLAKENPLEFGFEVFDSFFKNNGYAVLYPEKLSLSEMIFYIRNSSTVASISGTPPHNMLFAKNGQKLLIMERCAINNDYQVVINRMKQLQTTYVDANFPIYTVRMTGPFIMGYNHHVAEFAASNGNMLPPDPSFCSEKYLNKCFTNYMKSYNDLYRYQWFTEPSIFPAVAYLAEAYEDSYHYFADYLNGTKPFFWYHYLLPHYWKQIIKSVLRKMRILH